MGRGPFQHRSTDRLQVSGSIAVPAAARRSHCAWDPESPIPSGLDPHHTEWLRRTGRLEGPIRIFEATPLVGESTEAARQAAQAWLVKKQPG
jgi:hypothetical protein